MRLGPSYADWFRDERRCRSGDNGRLGELRMRRSPTVAAGVPRLGELSPDPAEPVLREDDDRPGNVVLRFAARIPWLRSRELDPWSRVDLGCYRRADYLRRREPRGRQPSLPRMIRQARLDWSEDVRRPDDRWQAEFRFGTAPLMAAVILCGRELDTRPVPNDGVEENARRTQLVVRCSSARDYLIPRLIGEPDIDPLGDERCGCRPDDRWQAQNRMARAIAGLCAT